MNTIINQVYKPMVNKLEPEQWAKCEPEQKKEFMHTFDKFAKELVEALRSLQSNIVLEPYPAKWKAEAQKVSHNSNVNQEMINDFEKIFNQWSEKIDSTLEEVEREQDKISNDAHPRQELEYWKGRMRKLTCVSEQLRSKNCRTVVDVLEAQTGSTTQDGLGKKDKIYLATSKFRSQELRVTESLNEAKDNVKYLQTLEKFIDPLYEGTPTTIKDTLPALMNSIKMIHTIARYYNTTERMTGLFVKITNQMIMNCKFNILNFRKIKLGLPTVGSITANTTGGTSKRAIFDDGVLWDEKEFPHDELIAMFQTCIDLHAAYLKQYNFTKERLQNMPKAPQFDFSENQIFGKFDLFCRRITKLMDLFETIKQFETLKKHNLEHIDPILSKFQDIVKKFK